MNYPALDIALVIAIFGLILLIIDWDRHQYPTIKMSQYMNTNHKSISQDATGGAG